MVARSPGTPCAGTARRRLAGRSATARTSVVTPPGRSRWRRGRRRRSGPASGAPGERRARGPSTAIRVRPITRLPTTTSADADGGEDQERPLLEHHGEHDARHGAHDRHPPDETRAGSCAAPRRSGSASGGREPGGGATPASRSATSVPTWPCCIASRYGDCGPRRGDRSAPPSTSSAACSASPLLAAICRDVQPSFHGAAADARHGVLGTARLQVAEQIGVHGRRCVATDLDVVPLLDGIVDPLARHARAGQSSCAGRRFESNAAVAVQLDAQRGGRSFVHAASVCRSAGPRGAIDVIGVGSVGGFSAINRRADAVLVGVAVLGADLRE